MGADDGGQAPMRPPPAHRSPNSRAKWSPLVHTITEAGESFSGTVFPAKLFSDDTSNALSPHDNNTDNRQETHGPSLEDTGASPLAPSLEPNASTAAVTTAHEQTEVPPALNDNDEQEEEAIPVDILLSEIQRLVAHEFGGPNKSASYPTVLKPLYQRLQDYHIMLKNARRKLDQHQQQHQQQRGATHLSPSSEALPPAISNLPMKQSHNTNLLEVPTATTPGSDACTPQLHQRIIDLEQQLAQSRRAHHTLLQDHILNLKKTSSHFLVGSSASGGFGGAATVKLPVLDACAIHGIMASVNSDSPSTPSLLFSSSVPGCCGNNKSKKKKKDSSLPRKESGSSGSSSVETSNDIFQETLQTAQELHNRHIRQLKGISISTSTNTSAPSTASSTLSSDSEPSLISISSHNLISEATTRLLRAETELGLLKLVMAQNQSEISGLEEDVFRAQRELKNHRQVFEALLELHHLGFEAQIREDQVLIKELEGKVRKCEGEKEDVERVVKKLEGELEEMERNLNQKRETYQRQELQLTEGPVRDLEAQIEQLKNELVAQETKMAEYRVQSEDEASQMTEFLEKQHRKATAEFKASLVKVQRSNTRLHKEVTALVQKMVSVETLNEEYAQQTARDRAQLSALHQQTQELEAQLSAASTSTDSPTSIEQQTEMKATITSLETQIEDLTTSLRLKEEELTHALQKTEHLLLKLDQDLLAQQEDHKTKLTALTEKHQVQAQRERACQSASVTLFQNMVTKLQIELSDTQEKLRDTTLCWGHTKEQLQKCEQSYRRRKKDLEETTRNLHELEETMAKLGDAIGMLEYEKEVNLVLVRTLEERDREMRDMEYRLRVLEDERD
ncbi:hypothetical protein EC957_008306 [Mortierella hygrophila]|uniref:Uncharacterized protein n=1 Tax=Mortierella hygrophila TaxID=979708 RepID=A0A9P6EX56_9FUNG|nr:hypothetical protein EC957_008306 [Mortierella hygrophila]